MGKLAENRRNQRSPSLRRKLVQLREKRRQLCTRLREVETELSRLQPKQSKPKIPTDAEFDQWFDELTKGLEGLPPLPSDFSRADIYDDHD